MSTTSKHTTTSTGRQDLVPFDDNNQYSIVAFVHDLYEPETFKEKDASKDDERRSSGTGKKKYANCYLQAESSWHFARIWGNDKNVNQQLTFMKMKEAEEKKKAIKLVVKKDVGLSERNVHNMCIAFSSCVEGEPVLHLTAYWKKSFQSFIENPSFQYQAKDIKTTKIGEIKKAPITSDIRYDVEVLVLRQSSQKRTAEGDRKKQFCLVDDGTGLMWLRSKFELQEKIWYAITNVQPFVCNDEIILLSSHDSFKQVAQRTDVRTSFASECTHAYA